MDPAKLESLFKRAMQTCKFFPKVSEILEPIRKAEETATPQAAIEAWSRVLALRREHYNPDFPQYLAVRVRALPERVQTACRASGVFGEFDSTEGLHTWAKKAFLESFARWGEAQQNEYLLPDGDLKTMLAEFAESKSIDRKPRALLQDSRPFPSTLEIAAKRIAAEKENKETVAKPFAPVCETPPVIDFESRSAELHRQAELIKAKYSKKEATA
jgi:hypothetical protein